MARAWIGVPGQRLVGSVGRLEFVPLAAGPGEDPWPGIDPLTGGPLPGMVPGSASFAGCDRYVTCLLRDVHCAGCGWGSRVSGSVSMITDAPQVPPVTALIRKTLQ